MIVTIINEVRKMAKGFLPFYLYYHLARTILTTIQYRQQVTSQVPTRRCGRISPVTSN